MSSILNSIFSGIGRLPFTTTEYRPARILYTVNDPPSVRKMVILKGPVLGETQI
jgi:hypothetical protein